MDTIETGLTFDDVLLVPKRSSVRSRKDVSLQTRITPSITLSIPLISANMDTVTESAMAIAMARHGGIGIIHRFLTIEQQVAQVMHVKRAESVFIENPLTIAPNRSLQEARQIMEQHNIHNLLVVSPTHKLLGILTHRDLLFETDLEQLVSSVMTTQVVAAPQGTTTQAAAEILKKQRVEKLPIVTSDGTLAGLYTSKDILNLRHVNGACKDAKGRLVAGAAVGVKHDVVERTEQLLAAETDVIVVDVAHGHSDLAIDTIKEIKRHFGPVEVMAGNVATAQAATDLIAAGADCIKVGVGPGATCVTRIVTGSGVPQLTAIMDCAQAAGDVPVIADGGIKTSGDITKALAAGADAVMMGSLLAGTDESPGIPILKNGKKYKVYRGMASLGATTGRQEREKGEWDTDISNVVAEGVESLRSYRGPVTDIIKQLMGGVRSGLSYSGATSISQLQQNAQFIRITHAGVRESNFHDLDVAL